MLNDISNLPKPPAEWLKRIHKAIHHNPLNGVVRHHVTIDGNLYRIRYTNDLKLPYIDKGSFRYLVQNPNTQSDWASMAKAGKKVTQILRGGEYYGVIVNNNVFRYLPDRKSEYVGKL